MLVKTQIEGPNDACGLWTKVSSKQSFDTWITQEWELKIYEFFANQVD